MKLRILRRRRGFFSAEVMIWALRQNALRARVNVVVLALYYFHVFLAAFCDSVYSSADPFDITLF